VPNLQSRSPTFQASVISPSLEKKNDPPRLVHGLRKCESEEYRAILNGKERLWNRDVLATLNFLAILNGLRSGQGRPVYLTREEQ